MTPQHMIDYIVSDNYDGDIVHNLYGAFYKGYPIENLSQLITSKDDAVRATGSYLVYELGNKILPLIEEVAVLLDDPNPQIRSDIIIALTECCTWKHKEIQGKITLKLDDPDPFVHRAVIKYIMRQTHNIGIREAAKISPGTIFEEISDMVPKATIVTKELLTILINHSNPIVRRFGVGMALRARSIINAEYLDIAEECNDEEGIGMIKHIRELSTPMGAKVAYINYIHDQNLRRSVID